MESGHWKTQHISLSQISKTRSDDRVAPQQKNFFFMVVSWITYPRLLYFPNVKISKQNKQNTSENAEFPKQVESLIFHFKNNKVLIRDSVKFQQIWLQCEINGISIRESEKMLRSRSSVKPVSSMHLGSFLVRLRQRNEMPFPVAQLCKPPVVSTLSNWETCKVCMSFGTNAEWYRNSYNPVTIFVFPQLSSQQEQDQMAFSCLYDANTHKW